MRQAEAFMDEEGDAFFQRNRHKPRLPDPVLNILSDLELQPKAVVEVGCGDGWRLQAIQNRHPDADCWGFDASLQAVESAQKRGLRVYHSATGFPLFKPADLIIFGFCLYVIDREDLFSWVEGADAVLEDGGHIIIHDFFPEYPYRRPYAHKEGLWSYKMDYRQLWLAHPGYREIRTDLFGEDDERTGVAVLKKDFANAFPVRKV